MPASACLSAEGEARARNELPRLKARRRGTSYTDESPAKGRDEQWDAEIDAFVSQWRGWRRCFLAERQRAARLSRRVANDGGHVMFARDAPKLKRYYILRFP